MKAYLAQLGGTDPNKWRTIMAESAMEALMQLAEETKGDLPETGFACSASGPRHSNGAPMCVQIYSLNIYDKNNNNSGNGAASGSDCSSSASSLPDAGS
jgi:hypothetical protein